MSTFLEISSRLKFFADRWSRRRIAAIMEKDEPAQLLPLLEEAYLAGAEKALREFVKNSQFKVSN